MAGLEMGYPLTDKDMGIVKKKEVESRITATEVLERNKEVVHSGGLPTGGLKSERPYNPERPDDAIVAWNPDPYTWEQLWQWATSTYDTIQPTRLLVKHDGEWIDYHVWKTL